MAAAMKMLIGGREELAGHTRKMPTQIDGLAKKSDPLDIRDHLISTIPSLHAINSRKWHLERAIFLIQARDKGFWSDFSRCLCLQGVI